MTGQGGNALSKRLGIFGDKMPVGRGQGGDALSKRWESLETQCPRPQSFLVSQTLSGICVTFSTFSPESAISLGMSALVQSVSARRFVALVIQFLLRICYNISMVLLKLNRNPLYFLPYVQVGESRAAAFLLEEVCESREILAEVKHGKFVSSVLVVQAGPAPFCTLHVLCCLVGSFLFVVWLWSVSLNSGCLSVCTPMCCGVSGFWNTVAKKVFQGTAKWLLRSVA